MGNKIEKNEPLLENAEILQKLDEIHKDNNTIELKQSIYELKKQIKALNKLVKSKDEKIEELTNALKEPSTNKIKMNHNVSKKKIEEIVDKMLEDPNMNIKYLPDFAERQIYINVFTLFLGIVDNLSDNINVDVMGHKIRLQVLENYVE